MKKFLFPRITFFFLLVLQSATMLAQDTTKTVTSSATSTAIVPGDETLWYMQPWVWVVGGVAILLLLIALLSGGKSKRTDRVIITKTIRTDSE